MVAFNPERPKEYFLCFKLAPFCGAGEESGKMYVVAFHHKGQRCTV